MPPPMSKTISLSVVPMGISTRPVRLTLPERANTLVPLEPLVPTDAKAAGPWEMISETLPKVSTLLMTVGLPNRPRTAG